MLEAFEGCHLGAFWKDFTSAFQGVVYVWLNDGKLNF
jgi:hypothetical protein